MTMRPRWRAVALVLVLPTACSSGEDARPAPAEPSTDGGMDAGTEITQVPAAPDATACEECRLFPDVCIEGAFCPVKAPLETSDRLLAIGAGSVSDVWAVGTMASVLHYDGTSWTRAPFARKETFGALLVRSSTDIWIGGSVLSSWVSSGALADGGAVSWTPVSNGDDVLSGALPIQGLWGASGSMRVWAALGARSLLSFYEPRLVHLKRNAGALVSTPVSRSRYAMKAVTGTSKDVVWVVGEHGLAQRVTEAESDAPMVTEYNTQTENTLNSVAVIADDDIVAVGNVGTIRRYRGQGLLWDRELDVPTNEPLRSVKALSPSDVWAVGDAATVLHFDGTRWERFPIGGLQGLRPDLHAVLPIDRDHVWIVGERIVLELRPRSGG